MVGVLKGAWVREVEGRNTSAALKDSTESAWEVTKNEAIPLSV